MTTLGQQQRGAVPGEREFYDETVTIHGSLEALFGMLARHRRLVASGALIVGVAVSAYALLKQAQYTSTASFVSQSTRTQSSSLGGIAAQFGIAIPGESGTDSPQFYLDLITSRAILDTVVGTVYAVSDGATVHQMSLVNVLGAKGSNTAKRTVDAEKRLREHLAGSVGKQTGVVNLSLSTPNAVLSKLVMQRILDAVNTFNLQKRQSRATAERKFVEARLASARDDLLTAENNLQRFMQENRVYNTAPRLSFEQDRLSRAVQNRQQIVDVLSQSYEQAKIDEVRDTPVITVLDTPEVAPAPDSRGVLTKLIFGILFGGVLGALAAWVIEMRATARLRSPSRSAI